MTNIMEIEHKKQLRQVSKMEKNWRIAVASKYGMLVDLHFGHTTSFAIYQGAKGNFSLVEKREVGQYCNGVEDDPQKDKILSAFQDCNALLVLRIGPTPEKKLKDQGCLVIEWCDSVETGLAYAFKKLEGGEINE